MWNKNLALKLCCIVLLVVSGCGVPTQKIAVMPGATTAPEGVRPLVLVNVKTINNLKDVWDNLSKTQRSMIMETLRFQNVESGQVYLPCIKGEYSIVSGSPIAAPYQISEDKTSTFVSLIVNIPPGKYKITKAWFVRPQAPGTSLADWDFMEEAIGLSIPDSDFVSLGTLEFNFDDTGLKTGDIIQGLKFHTCKKSVKLREMTKDEEGFVIESYPLLKTLLNK